MTRRSYIAALVVAVGLFAVSNVDALTNWGNPFGGDVVTNLTVSNDLTVGNDTSLVNLDATGTVDLSSATVTFGDSIEANEIVSKAGSDLYLSAGDAKRYIYARHPFTARSAINAEAAINVKNGATVSQISTQVDGDLSLDSAGDIVTADNFVTSGDISVTTGTLKYKNTISASGQNPQIYLGGAAVNNSRFFGNLSTDHAGFLGGVNHDHMFVVTNGNAHTDATNFGIADAGYQQLCIVGNTVGDQVCLSTDSINDKSTIAATDDLIMTTPSNFTFTGGVIMTRTAVTTPTYTVLVNDYILGVNDGNTVTMSFPDAIQSAGKTWVVKDESMDCSSDKTIILRGNGTNTIDGATQYLLNTDGAAVNIYSTGPNMFTY